LSKSENILSGIVDLAPKAGISDLLLPPLCRFFGSRRAKLLAGSAVFGFLHIVFYNPISPLLSIFAGYFLTDSYLRHGSLKKLTIEHAFYGDMVFTVGLGIYFLLHAV
jgi:hypothetical protein